MTLDHFLRIWRLFQLVPYLEIDYDRISPNKENTEFASPLGSPACSKIYTVATSRWIYAYSAAKTAEPVDFLTVRV